MNQNWNKGYATLLFVLAAGLFLPSPHPGPLAGLAAVLVIVGLVLWLT
jgi:hypothetical protein